MAAIRMFGTENDSGSWAVCVDGKYGLFKTKDEAEEVYKSIGGHDGDDGHYKPVYRDGWTPPEGIDKLSLHKPIDIRGYIKKKPIRLSLRAHTPVRTLEQRLADKNFSEEFFGVSKEGEQLLSKRQEELEKASRQARYKAFSALYIEKRHSRGKRGSHPSISRMK